jgi:peptidyl-prolyl cis-trans isomerase B (cyclophilin B)
MFFAKASLIFAAVSLAAIVCAQSAEAARGPKITSKVYFDIKHGDKPMGRSTFTSLSRRCPFKYLSDEF